MKTYKSYQLQTNENSTMIYKDGKLVGATYTDEGKNNSEIKAIERIDKGMVNYIKQP